MDDRARGVFLYACAAALLAGGAVWWVQAAPSGAVSPTIEEWRETALRRLPDPDRAADADTVTLEAGDDHEVVAEVGGGGEVVVSVLCVGGENSRVRVSLGEFGTDSGHGLNCTSDQAADEFSVAVADQLRMNVMVNEEGPVVFRYAVHRPTD